MCSSLRRMHAAIHGHTRHDYVVGVVLSAAAFGGQLSVRYEHEPWQPKQGDAAVHHEDA